MLDDELPAVEQELLAARMARDEKLRARWQRYSLISDTLRNHLPDHADEALASRVMQALEPEAPLHARRRLPGWARPMAGAAVAASVAVAAVLAVQNVNRQGLERPAPSVASAPAGYGANELPASRSPVLDAHWQPAQAPSSPQLDRYLVNHNEYAASSGVQGMLPYVRIVGYHNGP
ncbi:MAG TPA: sigma-E factor negative regulatory protein, partial [Gammaproteobacteria bacterium]|nr:sigma-E factor negative regulatory protein [Gammaproteobacteria bacterium]